MSPRHLPLRGVLLSRLFFVAIVIAFSVAGVLSVQRLVAQQDALYLQYRNGAWIASQTEVQFHRFLERLSRYRLDPSPESAANLSDRFDILWSRIPVMLESSEAEALRTLPGVVEAGNELRRLIAAMDPYVQRVTALSPGEHAELDALIGRASPLVDRIVQETVRATVSEPMIAAKQDIARQQTETIVYFAIVLASGFGLILLLLRQTARTAKLAERNAHLAAAVAATTAGVVITDPSKPGNPIVFANAAFHRLTGFGREETLGRDICFLAAPEADAGTIARLEDAMARGEAATALLRFRRRDGEGWWNEIILSPVYTAGRMSAWVGLFTDATERIASERERAQMAERMHRAQKMEAIGRLAGGVAHDFNNMLAAILGYASLLLEDLKSDSEQHGFVRQIVKAGERGRDLVQQILAFSRQRIGQEHAVVALDRLMDDTLALLRATLPRTIDLSVRVDAARPTIEGSPSQLEQVLLNLCLNARDAIQGTGRIEVELAEGVDETEILGQLRQRISTEYADLHVHADDAGTTLWVGALDTDDCLRLTVRDTGCGMTRDVMERMFDPFYTTKDVGQGTGLGLAAALGIVSGHGGALVVRSAAGRGTSFSIYLPRTSRAAVPDPGTSGGPTRLQGRVLLVDDEPGVLDATRRGLERIGFEVTACGDARQALMVLAAQPDRWRAVVTDLTMPGMTGADLADAARRLRADLPVVLCTGYGERLSDDAGNGAAAVLQKPVSVHQLATTIERLTDVELDRVQIAL